MNMQTAAFLVDLELDPWHRYHSCKAMARGLAENKKSDKARLNLARTFCAAVVTSYWAALCKRHQTTMKVKSISLPLTSLALDARKMADSVGSLIAEFPVEDAGYLIGSIYTVMLPVSIRSEMGAYYTPPPLVTRLLNMAESAGFDFTHGKVIDPACGGGAFLAPVALRIIQKSKDASAEWIIRRLGKQLRGIELDPFAAWMTCVLLEAAVMPLCIKARRRLPDVVTVADALDQEDMGSFDLVIGNPPYGRIKLNESQRKKYSRSLYGHANLYGLFTDLALRLVKTDGVIAYITPTSFLGGQYFKALRKLIAQEASPVAFDFVTDRNGVFDNVQQETLLTTFARNSGSSSKPTTISALIPKGLNKAQSEFIGETTIPSTGDPWLLPRTTSDTLFLERIMRMPTRLTDLGYGVSTGPLVWNRHKSQLRIEASSNTLPLIWAESVGPDGFTFRAERRNHVPFIAVTPEQSHLVARQSSLLVQRTTSKEQNRRLLGAILPQPLLDQHGGAVIENHLNIIQPISPLQEKVSLKTIAALLNSEAVDRAFRCISGSVAVSAYELNALPLPSIEQIRDLEKLVVRGSTEKSIERFIASCYGVA